MKAISVQINKTAKYESSGPGESVAFPDAASENRRKSKSYPPKALGFPKAFLANVNTINIQTAKNVILINLHLTPRLIFLIELFFV